MRWCGSMISIEQIKAARALLEWTQEDLASAAGLSKPAINMLERRLSNPTMDTLNAIQTALERAGVEFTAGPGVRLCSAILKTQIFEGDDSLLRLAHDIFETLKGTDGALMVAGIDEKKYRNIGGPRILKEIEKRRRHGIRSLYLSCEGDLNFIESVEFYRWVPREFFSRTPWYVYGNKYAIFLWGPPKKVVLIENSEIAETYRQQFLAQWNSGEIPHTTDRI